MTATRRSRIRKPPPCTRHVRSALPCSFWKEPKKMRVDAGGAVGGAETPQSSWLSRITTVLKTGNGRQGHSWVRIPPPPCIGPNSA